MGFWRKLRHRRALRRYRRAAEAYRLEQARWDRDAAELRGQIDVARTFAGATVTDEPQIPLRLHPGERVFSVFQQVGLVEARSTGGHWEGGSSGFSFRVAKGVRWHVGATKGRYAKGEERPTLIDTGTATVTDRRVVFQGPKQSREWNFDKLLGYRHASPEPMTSFQVSNRQRVSGLLYDQDQAPEVHFRLALALAHHQGTVTELERHLEAELAAHEHDRPPPPELPPKIRTALRHER